MKALPLLLGSLLLLGGCFHAPSAYSSQLAAVTSSYKAIDRGASRADIETRLGPAVRMEDGVAVWETRFDRINAVRLKVRFDAADQAQHLELTRERGTATPGFQVNSSLTTSSGSK
jgi:hypothetical protein